MAAMKLRKIAVALALYMMIVKAKLVCRRGYGALRCEPAKTDYVLKRGLVSDNNETTIILSLCRIIEVDVDAFKNDPVLKDIDLSRNKISELKLGVFDDVKTLTSLRIARNLLTTLPLGIFDQLSKLNSLDLRDNKIISFELGIFDSLRKLVKLRMAGNGFSGRDLNPLLFRQNTKLKFLDFSSNNMSGTHENLLSTLHFLDTMELNNCSLREVPKFATTSNLRKMRILLLQVNEIQKIDDRTFENLVNLQHLDLRGNMIENINVDALKPLRSLYLLDLPFNQITEIPEDLFLNVPALQTLDLSYNFIEYVPVDIFLHKSSLKTLKLVSNRISYLDQNFFHTLRRKAELTRLYIEGNPFQCKCLLEIINEMKLYGYKYDSERYNGENAVCLMTDKFICKRDRPPGLSR